jgi:hypothetical protein
MPRGHPVIGLFSQVGPLAVGLNASMTESAIHPSALPMATTIHE